MKDYCLYYLPKSNDSINDVMMIYFGKNLSITNRRDKDGYSILFNKDKIIGYLIHNFTRFAKIKIAGTIFLANDALVDLINTILSNFSLSNIENKYSSGFVIGKIVDKKQLDKSTFYRVDIAKCFINVESTFNLDINDKVVIALNGTYLLPAQMIQTYEIIKGIKSDGRICSYIDLQMNGVNQQLPVIINDVEVGKDFFLTKEKHDA